MNIVIIEDEEFAARRLEQMINEVDPEIQIISRLESVASSVEWFRKNPSPDLILMDIHLEDNLSFSIFNSVTITSPIVFTTATDDLSTRAFKLKQIDFLLKPIVQTELVRMIEKYRNLPESERRIMDASFFADLLDKSGKDK
jgi:DNA-binding LytR/AlgR family response regulator